MRKISDKRLSSDLASLCHDLWMLRGTKVDSPYPTELGDKVRWIDASAMLVGCLTKAMAPEALRLAFDSGCFDVTAAQVSVGQKAKKAHARKLNKDKKASSL